TIRSIIPLDSLTEQISIFLYTHVVLANDPTYAWNGREGPVIEVEAKLGQLFDSNLQERLSLPVESDCIISSRDSRLRTNFRSSMTEKQHRDLNQFLNQCFQESQPRPGQPVSRVPMKYVHTKERDTFHELPPSQYSLFPPSLKDYFFSRGKPRVRVTTDTKTEKVLHSIVKARIADLNVFCPNSLFDFRISVNIELPWKGQVGPVSERQGKERCKDRMSYKHLAYQIDLTQV
ncbi:mRNA triphosphatase CET1, partial [Ascobolus immersus RN42]